MSNIIDAHGTTPKPHMYRVVRRIEDRHGGNFIATVTCHHLHASWDERISFKVLRLWKDAKVIQVRDVDYPDDRVFEYCVPWDADMRKVITDFVYSGRW